MSGRPGDAVREVLAWTQTILIMVAFYGGQAIFRDNRIGWRWRPTICRTGSMYLPPAWLAQFVDSTSPASNGTKWWILGLGVLFIVALWTLVMQRISILYARMQPGGAAWQRATLPALRQPGRLGGALTRLLTRSRTEAAAFWLCSMMLRRDHDLRMRSWPSLGMGLALVLLGLFTGQLGDPFVTQTTSAVVLPIACSLSTGISAADDNS